MYKIKLQRDFFETCNKWPKWQNVPVDIKILSPGGCQPLPRGYIQYEKMCIKSDFEFMYLVVSLWFWGQDVGSDCIAYLFTFQIDVFETCSKWLKWQEVSVDIKIYTLIKSWKDVYEVRGWTNDLPADIKMLVLMYCLPPPKGYIHVENHEKVCIKSEGIANFWNMQSVIKVIRPFCFHQQNCPQGLSHLALGLDTLYTCMK